MNTQKPNTKRASKSLIRHSKAKFDKIKNPTIREVLLKTRNKKSAGWDDYKYPDYFDHFDSPSWSEKGG